MFLFSCHLEANMQGTSQHQDDEVLHFRDLACRELERAGMALFGEEIMGGDVMQGTCSLQVS